MTSHTLYRCRCCCLYYSSADHRDLHSFPTRRSSDLSKEPLFGELGLADPTLDDDTLIAAMAEHTVLLNRVFGHRRDRKSTRLNSSHVKISYAVFCLKKKKMSKLQQTTHIPARAVNQI